MKNVIPMRPSKAHLAMILISLISLLLPAPIYQAAPVIEVVVEEPQLHPASSTCPASYWYTIPNDRGHTAYLTLNAYNPQNSTNQGEWRPAIAQAGYYRVEAYIASHAPILWCTGTIGTIQHDTTDAHYSINFAGGVATRSVSQYPLSNAWLDLGEYYFNAGTQGYVTLTDLNLEPDFTTTVSFSAMRFTYTRASRPNIYLPMVTRTIPGGIPPPDVGVVQAQGFDVCTLPSLSTMQNWWNNSPYSFYGLYLGGIQLPAQCVPATAAWVSAAHQQGWSFIPTWVGPQAPCSPWSRKMSWDPAVTYQQGRQEADAASNKAAALGLTNNGLGGTIIYYDMEVFGSYDLACRHAASAFMNGWVERLGELGNLAGGYGAHNSYVEDWATISHVPQDVWAASWYATSYDPYASVNTIPWLQGLWTSHQRIRQYAGEIHDSWGGIGMTIDSDVADGMMAMPPSSPMANAVVISSPLIVDTGWVNPDQGWVVSDQHLFWTTDQGKTWLDISPAPVQNAYLLASGQAWALSSPDETETTLYLSSDFGSTWKSQQLSLPPGQWFPRQVQFSSSSTGWISFQRVASSAFASAILLHTMDRGLSWQASDLPTTGRIDFTSPTDGWILNDESQQLFHTLDGGITWQRAELSNDPFLTVTQPAGTTLSGSQPGGFLWAASSEGTCTGKKGTAGFTCQVDHRLWQSVDDGKTWQSITLPGVTSDLP